MERQNPEKLEIFQLMVVLETKMKDLQMSETQIVMMWKVIGHRFDFVTHLNSGLL